MHTPPPSSVDIFRDDIPSEFNKMWVVIRHYPGVEVLVAVGPVRAFLKVFCVVFLAFAWGLILWTRGREGVLILVPFTAVALLCCSFMLWYVSQVERAGNFVEIAGTRTIRLPRQGVSLKYEQISAVLLAEGWVKTAENQFKATQVLLMLPCDEAGFRVIPVISCMYCKDAKEVAEALSDDVRVPLIVCH